MNEHIALEFSELGNLLNTPSKQKARNCTSELKNIKVTNTFLMSLLLQTSFKHGDRFINEILKIIFSLLEYILNSANPVSILKDLYKDLNPESHTHHLSASRTTVMNHLPQLTKQKMFQPFSAPYVDLLSVQVYCYLSVSGP